MVAALAFMVVVSPWFVRNYVTFHKVVPFRGNLGLELYSGNTDDTSRWSKGDLQLRTATRNGRNMSSRGKCDTCSTNGNRPSPSFPAIRDLFLWVSLRRALYMWTNLESRSRLSAGRTLRTTRHLSEHLNVGVGTLGPVDGMLHFGRGHGSPRCSALFFPAVYYAVSSEDYFRRQ